MRLAALAVVAALCLLAVAIIASAAEVQGNSIVLDEGDVRVCVEGGGCMVITVKALARLRAACSLDRT